MFIIFILVLLAILMGVLSSIYSTFSPFIENIGNVVYFNSSYYWALAWIERAQLVLKYKQPGFEWSGWFIEGVWFWPNSDQISWSLGLLTNTTNWFSWKITSRTTAIPNPWQGNVDYLLSTWDSKDYNKLPYFTSEKISLSIDNTSDTNLYYSGVSSFAYFSWWSFSGVIRLSPKAKEIFNNELLCDTCDPDQDGIANDIVVNWLLDWFHNGVSFAIVPTFSILYYSWWYVDTTQDIAMREQFINQTGQIYFWDSFKWFSPLVNYTNTLTQHNVLWLDPSWVETTPFKDILSQSSITWLKLGFWIINLLTTIDGNIYPFLEYKFSFPEPVASNFFTLEGVGLVGDYNVKIFIKKPTNEQSSIGDFTIIF